MTNPKKQITASVISDLATDQRVIRICNSLQQMGFEVSVIARHLNNSLPLEAYLFKTKRIHCYFTKGIMQYAEFNIKLFFVLLFTKTYYLLANDLDTLLPNFLISKLRGKYLFYDTHEYFTGVPELSHSHAKRKAWKKLEDWIFPKLKTVYTVNTSVKNEYEGEYHVPVSIVRNVPVTQKLTMAEMPQHWKDKIILLAQGAGFNEGRSCMEMVEAMPYLDKKFHLVFIGGGNQWEKLMQKRTELGLENRFDMLNKMLPSTLKTFTSMAQLGISLDSFTDKNCLFNLPNKVFDYLHAGVPMLVTAIPEVKKVVEQYGCGICIIDTSPQSIACIITNLFNNGDHYKTMKKNAILAAKDLCWEKEEEKLKTIYATFL